MEPDPQKCEREPTRAPERGHQNATPAYSTSPQANGILRLLEMAQAEAATARDPQARRAAQHRANALRRRLRPGPVDGGAAAAEAILSARVNELVLWAERRASR